MYKSRLSITTKHADIQCGVPVYLKTISLSLFQLVDTVHCHKNALKRLSQHCTSCSDVGVNVSATPFHWRAVGAGVRWPTGCNLSASGGTFTNNALPRLRGRRRRRPREPGRWGNGSTTVSRDSGITPKYQKITEFLWGGAYLIIFWSVGCVTFIAT